MYAAPGFLHAEADVTGTRRYVEAPHEGIKKGSLFPGSLLLSHQRFFFSSKLEQCRAMVSI